MSRSPFRIAMLALCAAVAGCAEPSLLPTAGATSSDLTQLAPDAIRGRKVAEQQCSRCHAIDLTDASAVADAPPLRDLFKRYPTDNLRAAFVQGVEVAHGRMPQFRLSQQDVDDLLTHLRSIDPCVQPSTDEAAMARCFAPL